VEVSSIDNLILESHARILKRIKHVFFNRMVWLCQYERELCVWMKSLSNQPKAFV
jgi:hypothetical protein